MGRQFVQDFKLFLDKKAIAHGNQKLSQNSKYSYFNKLRAALKQAVKDGIIPTNPSEGVEAFKQGEPEREFLTLEELQAAVNAECEIPQMKTAFIFSCLTGLRWSDINKLLWSEVQHSNWGTISGSDRRKPKERKPYPFQNKPLACLANVRTKTRGFSKG